MRLMSSMRIPVRRRFRHVALLLACALAGSIVAGAVPAAAQTPGAVSSAGANASNASGGAVPPGTSATLQQCLATGGQSERSATLAGEMTAIAGTARMEMRINLVEKLPGELEYRVVSAPGLGTWRFSAPGVKLFTSINHVTNLSSPALYRGAIRFRWLNAKGHVIKVEELRTPRCEQPAVGSMSAPAT